MSKTRDQFDWMRETMYEPVPLRHRSNRVWFAFGILAVLAIVTGGLIAVAA